MGDINVTELARESGFEVVEKIDPQTLKFMVEIRDMCAQNKCGNYDKSWSCPPACGDLQELQERCAQYNSGIIFQTVGRMENEFDFEGMQEGGKRHGDNYRLFKQKIADNQINAFPMGAGTCRYCEKCTYPDEPCRFPELVTPSMEACGLFVSQICKDNDVVYYHGKNTITYVGCCLYNE